MVQQQDDPADKDACNASCPACGQAFRCGMAAGCDACWCAELPPVAPVPRSGEVTCLCEQCLSERIAQRRQAGAK